MTEAATRLESPGREPPVEDDGDASPPWWQRRWVLVGSGLALVLAVIGWRVLSGPSEEEKQQDRTEEIAEEQSSLPQGEDAWYKVEEACDLRDATFTGYYENGDLKGEYDYTDDVGYNHTATVSMNDYGTITWIDNCDHLDGIEDTYEDRVEVDW